VGDMRAESGGLVAGQPVAHSVSSQGSPSNTMGRVPRRDRLLHVAIPSRDITERTTGCFSSRHWISIARLGADTDSENVRIDQPFSSSSSALKELRHVCTEFQTLGNGDQGAILQPTQTRGISPIFPIDHSIAQDSINPLSGSRPAIAAVEGAFSIDGNPCGARYRRARARRHRCAGPC
jgi:hypothetical protein